MWILMNSDEIIPANQSVMNSEHMNPRDYRSVWIRCFWGFFAIVFGMTLAPSLARSSALYSKSGYATQGAGNSIDAEFSSTVAAMARLEPSDAESIERLEKKAL